MPLEAGAEPSASEGGGGWFASTLGALTGSGSGSSSPPPAGSGGVLSREQREAETQRVKDAYDRMDIVHLMDKELHDRGGQFQAHLRVMRSVGEQALLDHGTSMLKPAAVAHNILEEMLWPQ